MGTTKKLTQEDIKNILLSEEGHNLKDYVCCSCNKLSLSLNHNGLCSGCVL